MGWLKGRGKLGLFDPLLGIWQAEAKSEMGSVKCTREFKKVFSKISGLSEFNEEYRKLQRNFFSGTATVELDANGRFVIPKNMLAYAQLEKDVILVGMGNKVEVWSPSIYEKHLIKDSSELSKLAEKYLTE